MTVELAAVFSGKGGAEHQVVSITKQKRTGELNHPSLSVLAKDMSPTGIEPVTLRSSVLRSPNWAIATFSTASRGAGLVLYFVEVTEFYPRSFALDDSKIYCSGWRFRSSDPWVMGPIRFLCAKPLDDIQKTIRDEGKRKKDGEKQRENESIQGGRDTAIHWKLLLYFWPPYLQKKRLKRVSISRPHGICCFWVTAVRSTNWAIKAPRGRSH